MNDYCAFLIHFLSAVEMQDGSVWSYMDSYMNVVSCQPDLHVSNDRKTLQNPIF